MTVLNADFSLPLSSAQPGRALYWDTAVVSVLEEYAQFSLNPPSEGEARETFETGWPVYVGQYVGQLQVGINAEAAIFFAGPGQRECEDFEEAWMAPAFPGQPGQQFLPLLASREQAVFATYTGTAFFDDFAWGHCFFEFTAADLIYANFYPGAHLTEEVWFEGYEFGWHDNEHYYTAWGSGFSTAAAVFTAPPPTVYELFESFEYVTARYEVATVSIDDNDLTFSDPAMDIAVGQPFWWLVEGEGEVPAPFRLETTYYRAASAGFRVATTVGGDYLNINDYGRGRLYLAHSPEQYWIDRIG